MPPIRQLRAQGGISLNDVSFYRDSCAKACDNRSLGLSTVR
jgi:hypothetical protein